MKTSITISTRIYGGFAMVLALLLAVAVAGLLALRSGSASLETYAKVSDNAVRVATIRGNLADMRRNVVNVANSGNATAIERVRQLEGSVRALLPLAIADTIDPGRLANLRRMQELFDQYATLFERVVTLKADKDRLVRERMTPLGVEARKKLLELLKGAAEDGDLAGVTLAAEADDALMAVRVDVNKYLVEPSPDLARQAEGQAENFAAYSDELVGRLREPARKALAQEARALAVQYQAAFAEVVTATNQLHEAVFVQMVGMGTQFTQLADDTTASQEAFLDGLKSDTIDGMHRGLTTSLAIAFAALALGVALSGLIARGIVRPVRAMTGVMGELADNNLTVAVPYAGQGDEIGAMARSVAHFKDQLIRVRQLEAEQEEQKKKAEAERLAAMRKMADTFEGSVGKVIGSVTSAASQLQAASGQMAGTATQTSTQATTVASAAQQASANVETVAAATEELAASIREIAQQVQRSQAVSVRACDEARTTNQHIQALSETASRIGQVVGLISTIAHQTNLLAMNATIEAARAGEAGKGFAVVAAEVKALATQTAEATDEIAAQIKAVQEGTASAVQAIDSITKVIGEMGEIGTAVAAAVEQQTGATGEIARNVEQASSGTAEVSSNIASVEQAARETGAAAGQIRDSATDLARQAEYLRGEVGQFLAQVRADKKDMRLLAWSDDLAFGIPTIDDHHRMLFEQVNELYREMMTGDAGRAAIATISRVGASVKDHFAEEEALMREHAYAAADTAEHARQHQLFLDHFAELGDAVAHNLPESGVRLFEYVATWFHEHITKSDKALADHLRAKG